MNNMSRVANAEAVVGNLRATLNEALSFVERLPDPKESIENTGRRGAGASSCQIRALINGRRRRDDFFPTNLFSDPAWDMLLELYATFLEQQRIPTSKLCISAAVPSTTALRWISTLEQMGLITKHGDPLDGRRVFIGLSATGKSMMDGYFWGEA